MVGSRSHQYVSSSSLVFPPNQHCFLFLFLEPDGSGYDERSDIYSWAIVCWEILTGLTDTPFYEFGGMPEMQIKKQISEGNLRPTLPVRNFKKRKKKKEKNF